MTQLSRKVLWLSIFMITTFVQAGNICDSLCHCLDVESNLAIVNCKTTKGSEPPIEDFDLFEWPKTNNNRSIQAFFNNMSLHILPRISGDSGVISLNFDDNLIKTFAPNPFQYFPNLEELSVANNLIYDISKDVFKTNVHMKVLNMANNSLTKLEAAVLEHLHELNEVDLSFNHLTKLTGDFVEAISAIEKLKLDSNQLFTIDVGRRTNVEHKLRKLSLTNNHFTVITTMFEQFKNLQSLDLSYNKITNIDENAFSSLDQLMLLDLSHNAIRTIYIKLPNTLELLAFGNNELVTWPLANTPHNLAELELQHNKLEHIFPKDREVNLKILSVAHNQIDNLSNTMFSQLEKIDLSYNLFRAVPQNLHQAAPLLRELILDGNEIEVVNIEGKTTLESISLSYMPLLKSIGPNAFSKLEGMKVRSDSSDTCINIKISHNAFLMVIDEKAFEGINICFLDLSYNQLMTVPQNLTDWTKIGDGFDIQGNPFSCNCEDQWMIQSILEKLYENPDHQFFLLDLKCHYPETLQGTRLIRFLNHENPFCNSISKNKFEKMVVVQESSFGGFFSGSHLLNGNKEIRLELTRGPGFVLVIAMCIVVFFAMVAVGIHWQRQQDRKNARRNRIYDFDY